jgi:Fic-DOC domain mobile mystery protein B
VTLQGPFEEPEGASPLDADDVAGLIPTWVATRGDLDTVEQENIGKAMTWASSRSGPKSLSSLLTEQMMRDLHRRMFGEVWKWAGSYRKHDTNIGVHWPQITTQVCDLLADVSTQAADGEHLPWPADELALRFHHRLGLIHPFPNGNGRHARLAADLLAEALGRPVFTWGAENLSQAGEVRSTYIDALRRADVSHDYEPLMIFARS